MVDSILRNLRLQILRTLELVSYKYNIINIILATVLLLKWLIQYLGICVYRYKVTNSGTEIFVCKCVNEQSEGDFEQIV